MMKFTIKMTSQLAATIQEADKVCKQKFYILVIKKIQATQGVENIENHSAILVQVL